MVENPETSSFLGIVRHPNGRLLPVRGAKPVEGVMSLHVQGLHVDYWASPRQLQRRGYTLLCAKGSLLDCWGAGLAQAPDARCGIG